MPKKKFPAMKSRARKAVRARRRPVERHRRGIHSGVTGPASGMGGSGSSVMVRRTSETLRDSQSPLSADVEDSGNRNTHAQPFPIVGVGASAGGLEALTQLLERMPAHAGMALIVVQHLDPAHRSILTELLAKATAMPVVEVTEGMEVEIDHVYVIPPNKAMEIKAGALRLTPRIKGEGGYRSIDTFLFSLAAQQRNRAIGVILSGTASDGTLGLRAIKEEGGITFAQDRESARFEGMPAAAVAAGAVDFVMPPSNIAAELLQIARHPYVLRKPEDDAAEDRQISDERLGAIFALVRAASGVDFTHYKHSTIRRRILRRMMLNRIERVDDYVDLLKRSSPEVTGLFNDILINVTDFFRDPEAFDALKTVVLPELLKMRGSSALPMRIWVAGCATGEEAYSIGILLLETFEATGHRVPVQIFATDISETALEKARAGIHPESGLTAVSPERRRRFFVKVAGGYQVAKIVRDMCMFARQDIGKDPPFSRIDFISCRNVLIYLGSTLQKRIIPAFHYALKPEGFLLLGSSESIGAFADLFGLVDKQNKIYRRKPGAFHFHIHPETMVPSLRHEMQSAVGPGGGAEMTNVEREADRMLLGRYSPPGVLIDESMTILQFRGQTGRYLEPAAGTASLNLMKMARPDLQTVLRKVIGEAFQRGTLTRIEDQRVRVNGSTHSVSIEVIPVVSVPVSQGRFLMVLFLEGRTGRNMADKSDTTPRSKGRREPDEVAKLRQELIATREYLQSVIEEQEAANEELRSANEEAQSTNEELQSINEELETAKEELQSTNEELTTINEELENVNQELTQANNDLKNLLDGVDVAIVMLGADLRVRRFTSPAGALLNLISTDVGRPLADLKPKLDAPDLEQWILDVTEKLVPVRRVVQGGDGRRYNLHIKPYRTADNKIDGVVLTIVDRAEADPREH